MLEAIKARKNQRENVKNILLSPDIYYDQVGLKELKLEEMREIASQSALRIRERIIKRKSYSTFLQPINQEILKNCEGQETIVLEIGGTNMRASKWKVIDGQLKPSNLEGSQGRLLDENDKEKIVFKDTDDFFDNLFNKAIPSLIDLIKKNPDAPLSIVFSFPGQPVEGEYGLDYHVGELTKGFKIPGLENKNFIPILNEYLNRKHKIEPRKIALFNDTAILLKENLGTVIGTGFNFALRMQVKRLREILGNPEFALGWNDEDYMIVNTESGNLGIAQKFAGDENPDSIFSRVDKMSNKPGEAQDEKLISGFYLREALRLVLEDLNEISGGKAVRGLSKNSKIETEHISMILNDDWNTEMPKWIKKLLKTGSFHGDLQPHETLLPFKVDNKFRPLIKRICQILRNRSTQIAASIVTGGLSLAEENSFNSNTEGSLYWKMPKYAKLFEEQLFLLNGEDFKITTKNANQQNDGLSNWGSQFFGAIAGLQYFYDREERKNNSI